VLVRRVSFRLGVEAAKKTGGKSVWRIWLRAAVLRTMRCRTSRCVSPAAVIAVIVFCCAQSFLGCSEDQTRSGARRAFLPAVVGVRLVRRGGEDERRGGEDEPWWSGVAKGVSGMTNFLGVSGNQKQNHGEANPVGSSGGGGSRGPGTKATGGAKDSTSLWEL